MNTFALIAAGRLVQPFVPIEANKFLLPIENALSVNHIVVFLTGATPLPLGAAGAVYLSWPSAPNEWKFLGFISNEKPSAIFRLGQPPPRGADVEMAPENATAQIGISLEPIASVQAQAQALAATQPPPAAAAGGRSYSLEDMAEYTKKMLDSFLNYAQSFVIQVPTPPAAFGAPPGSVPCIPADVLEKWYAQFQRKLQLDPAFWRRPATD